VSICYSKFRSPISWKFHDLDFILSEGDSNFKRLGLRETPFIDQFPNMIMVEEQECNTEFKVFDGEFSPNDITINFISEDLLFRHSGALIVISSYSIAVTFYSREYFVFDSHSRDKLGNT